MNDRKILELSIQNDRTLVLLSGASTGGPPPGGRHHRLQRQLDDPDRRQPQGRRGHRLAREWRDAWGFISDRRITVYGTEWAIGDRLVCRRNDYSIGVRNGTQGTVVDLGRHAEHLDLLTDYGQTVRIPADYLAHARHGYALTGHVSQGESVDRTLVLASPERGGAGWAYVAASRQRHDLQVFVTHHEAENVEDALARAWSRSQAESLALDLVDPRQREAAIHRVRADPDGAMPERLLAYAEELRAQREDVRERLRATGDDRARRSEVTRALERAEVGLRQAEQRQDVLTDRLEGTPAWRRRDRAQLRVNLGRAAEEVDRHRADGRVARAELARRGPARDDGREQAQRLSAELSEVERGLSAWDRGGQDRGREWPPPERGLSR